MTFRREKRLFLGVLALLAPLPLPFNEVLEWPVLFLYLLLVLVFLSRADHDRDTRPPNWLLNVLGLLYLPVLAVDFQVSLFRGRVVTSLLHLILFLVVVKLFALHREKEKWHLVVALFFVFVAAMATSSHLSVAPYLLVFTVLGLWLLARFAYLHALAAAGERRRERAPLHLGRPITATVLLVLMAAVPLFAVVPRFRQPLILGRGGGNAGLIRSAGFSDEVDLNLTSSVRGNRTVVMRVEVDRAAIDVESMRFKGNAFDYYRDRSWHRERGHGGSLPETGDGLLLLAARGRLATERIAEAELYLEPIGSTSVVLPVSTLGFELLGRRMAPPALGAGGAVSLPFPPGETLRYRAVLAAAPVVASHLDRAVAEAVAGAGEPLDAAAIEGVVGALDQGGITEPMRRLAAEVMGEGPLETRIAELERHLLQEYDYTLDFVGREGIDPISDFLFTYRSGHCELFATSMVLLLRSQGVPARLVTGFLGAERNRLEDYFAVRQSNAHAWVEAYTPDAGWRIYDPTPPEGRPGQAERDLGLLLAQLYDYLTFRWDRYVLSFGAEDQVDLLARLRAWLAELRRRFDSGEEAVTPPAGPPEEVAPAPAGEAVGGLDRGWIFAVVMAGAALWALLAFLYRQAFDAAAAYRRLRSSAELAGLELTPATPPVALRRELAARLPEAAPAVGRVVELYLAESFAGRTTTADERRELRRALAVVATTAERAARDARREARRRQPAPAGTG